MDWQNVVVGVVTVIMLAIIYAGLVHHINPPSNIETIDPKTLHLSGEFTEANLNPGAGSDLAAVKAMVKRARQDKAT